MKITLRTVFVFLTYFFLALQLILVLKFLIQGDIHQASVSSTISFWMGLTLYFEGKYQRMVKAAKDFKNFLDNKNYQE